MSSNKDDEIFVKPAEKNMLWYLLILHLVLEEVIFLLVSFLENQSTNQTKPTLDPVLKCTHDSVWREFYKVWSLSLEYTV